MMTDIGEVDSDGCFAYLSREDSDLYQQVRLSSDPKDMRIKQLLERIANASRAAHHASRY